MKRALLIVASIIGVLCVVGLALFLWASSGPLPAEELAQIKTYSASPASPEQDTFTVMSYDLGYLARSTNRTSRATADSLAATKLDLAARIIQQANPDIVGLQEVNFGAGPSFASGHQLDSLATWLGYPGAAQAVTWNERYLPASFGPPGLHSGRAVGGQALLSRFPIRKHVRRTLPQSSGFSLEKAFSRNDLVQVTAVDIGGWPLLIMNVQLAKDDVDTREQQARTVNKLYKRLARQGFPILLIGNLNSLRPTGAMTVASTDETMEILLDGTDLRPAFPGSANVTGASIGTYPASNPKHKLDYIYYRARFIVPINTEIECGKSFSPPSDHCAISMSFLLPRPKGKLPEKRIPDDQLPSLDSLMSQ